MHLTDTSCALRSLSEAVKSNRDRCTVELAVLCRTATHIDPCAYSDAFLSRGTRAERYCKKGEGLANIDERLSGDEPTFSNC